MIEALARAHAQRYIGNYREALILYQEVRVVRVRRRNEPPFSSLMDIAGTHIEIAKMLRKIVQYNLVDNILIASYSGEYASHLLKAVRIFHNMLREENKLTQETWELMLEW